MTLVIDASVALKWGFPEDDSDVARSIAIGADELIAPDLIVTETANAIWKLQRMKRVDEKNAKKIFNEIHGGRITVVATHTLVPYALDLGMELDHPIYDCLYLALAKRESATLVTADERFFGRISKSKHKASIARLRDYSPA